MRRIAYVSCNINIPERVLMEHVQFLIDTKAFDKVRYWDRYTAYDRDILKDITDLFVVYASPTEGILGMGSYTEIIRAHENGAHVYILYKRKTDHTYNIYHGAVRDLDKSSYKSKAEMHIASKAITKEVLNESNSPEITSPKYKGEINPEESIKDSYETVYVEANLKKLLIG